MSIGGDDQNSSIISARRDSYRDRNDVFQIFTLYGGQLTARFISAQMNWTRDTGTE